MERAEELLAVWFGPLDADGLPAPARVRRWFAVDPGFDESLRRVFAPDLAAARRGELDGWQATPRGRLALVLLLDQLGRNLHRGTPEAFAGDARALALARAALAAGDADRLLPIEQVFLLLPFEHAEDPDAQATSVAGFERLLAAAPARGRPLFEEFLDYARRHRDVIARFGRFPHRNAALGRATTPEEAAFLATPGSSF